jgi:hypothetical protein
MLGGQPVTQETQQLGQLGGIPGVQTHGGHDNYLRSDVTTGASVVVGPRQRRPRR